MSEIPKGVDRYGLNGQHPEGGFVRLCDVPAIREQALADATARIEGLKDTPPMPAEFREAWNRAIDHALAALTQPQTEKMCPVCRNVGPPGYNCSECDGGGAATAAGVADADLEAAAMEISVKATRLDPETYKVPDKLIWMLRSALFPNEDMERIKSPGPYAKAFREKFPVPEFPGIKNRQEDQA